MNSSSLEDRYRETLSREFLSCIIIILFYTWYIYIYIYVCVCVCVCVWERERERERVVINNNKWKPHTVNIVEYSSCFFVVFTISRILSTWLIGARYFSPKLIDLWRDRRPKERYCPVISDRILTTNVQGTVTDIVSSSSRVTRLRFAICTRLWTDRAKQNNW